LSENFKFTDFITRRNLRNQKPVPIKLTERYLGSFEYGFCGSQARAAKLEPGEKRRDMHLLICDFYD
jgi:hypothetical protein